MCPHDSLFGVVQQDGTLLLECNECGHTGKLIDLIGEDIEIHVQPS